MTQFQTILPSELAELYGSNLAHVLQDQQYIVRHKVKPKSFIRETQIKSSVRPEPVEGLAVPIDCYRFKGASKNSEFAQMQGVEKILVPANLKVTLL